MKHEYWISADLMGQSSKGTASTNFAFDRPLRPSDMNEVARLFRELPIVPSGTSVIVTSIFKFEGEPSEGEANPSVSVKAIEDLIVRSKYSNGQAIIEGLRRLIAGAR